MGKPVRPRVWISFLLIWAVVVVLFSIVGGSSAGVSALIGGLVGGIRALVAIRFLGRRAVGNRKHDSF